MVIDYSKWNNIDCGSDDNDDTVINLDPNTNDMCDFFDTKELIFSLFRN